VFICWQEDVNTVKPVDPDAKEVSFNPKYEQLFTPQVSFFLLLLSLLSMDFLHFAMGIRDFLLTHCASHRTTYTSCW